MNSNNSRCTVTRVILGCFHSEHTFICQRDTAPLLSLLWLDFTPDEGKLNGAVTSFSHPPIVISTGRALIHPAACGHLYGN